MPYSLRWIGMLFACAFLVASGALVAQFLLTKREARLMAEPLAGGNVELGRNAMARYQCGACHVIPGVRDAVGVAGPSLSQIAIRQTLAGRLPNTPETLEAWLRHPKEIDPTGGMPDMGVTEKESRDMAAFLYTRR